jgi:hypothetical protein
MSPSEPLAMFKFRDWGHVKGDVHGLKAPASAPPQTKRNFLHATRRTAQDFLQSFKQKQVWEGITKDRVHQDLPHQDSFRLLQILPGQEKSPLCCKLQVHRLYDLPPKYKALSYA